MSDRGSKAGLLVVAGVVAIGAAGIAVWLLWWTPKQEREAARAQVAEWEHHWSVTRRCLLGDRPLTADPGDALALAEITGTRAGQYDDCTSLVSRLVRPPQASTVEAVERAWAGVDASVPALANAFALLAGASEDSLDRAIGELGIAITALDGAHDTLRAAAGLAVLDRGGTVTLLRLGEPHPLVIGESPLQLWHATVKAGAISSFSTGQPAGPIAFLGPDRMVGGSLGVDQRIAVPGRAWKTSQTDDGAIVAMSTTDDGSPPSVVVPAGGAYRALAALGDGNTHVVVLAPAAPAGQPRPADPSLFALATSTDRGRRWTIQPGPPIPAGVDPLVPDHLDPAIDVVDVWTNAPSGALLYQFDGAAPTAIPTAVEVPGLPTSTPCRRGGTTWWLDGETVYQIGRGKRTEHVLTIEGDGRLVDCTATAALIEAGLGPVEYHRCTAGGCQLAFRGPGDAHHHAALLDDGTVVYAAGRAAVLALWTEGKADPVYFELPRPMMLTGIVVWNNVPHATVGDGGPTERGLHTVPLAGQQ